MKTVPGSQNEPIGPKWQSLSKKTSKEKRYQMGYKTVVFLVVGTVIFFLCSVSSAEVPHMINYQGKLTTASGGCLNDTVQMTFCIYPDTLGSPADWSETQTEIVVKEGIFNVLLGSVDTIPQAVFDGTVKYLGVQVDSDLEMSPLRPMVSVAYAYRSGDDGDWTADDGNIYREQGYVGIGTTTPDRQLDIAGHVGRLRVLGKYSNAEVTLESLGDGGVPWLLKTGNNASTFNGRFSLLCGPGEWLTILPNGHVGIGTPNPAYRLDVYGDINVAGSYNVKKGDVDYNHPDYVFEPDYKLMSLDELREYVFEKKCLPNVISAEDVKKNDGFKMDNLLIQMLEKLEEQTLYIFQLEDRIAELEESSKSR
jgi:hypothetical protein